MTYQGSGKTYLAAFDALNFNPKRLLYIVHEGSILKKSLETFQEVFGKNVSYGIYSGASKESDADFVFATNITMCNTLELFSKNEFDYIIIDEYIIDLTKHQNKTSFLLGRHKHPACLKRQVM